jgi:hypothetical protein
MADVDIDTALGWRGRTVRDRDGEKIGTFGDVFLDERDRPAWASVRTGLFGRRESCVPLDEATEVDGDVRLPYPAELVKEAPQVDPDVALEPDEEDRLHAHYGRDAVPADVEMVRSEEEVSLGPVERRPTERVRLRKVTVTEDVTQRIPVRREVVQLEHEPPPEGEIESAQDAGEAPPENR